MISPPVAKARADSALLPRRKVSERTRLPKRRALVTGDPSKGPGPPLTGVTSGGSSGIVRSATNL